MQRLERDLAGIDADMARCARLLKLADPDGYFKEGTRAAADAKARGPAMLAAERQRKEAAAAAAAAKRREQLVSLRTHAEERCVGSYQLLGMSTAVMGCINKGLDSM